MQRLLRESRFAETWQNENPKYIIENGDIGNVKTYFARKNHVNTHVYIAVAIVAADKNNELCILNIYCGDVKLAEQFIIDYEVEPYTYNLFVTYPITEKLDFKPIRIYVFNGCKINDELLPMCISYNRGWYESDTSSSTKSRNFKSIIDNADYEMEYSIAKKLQRGEPIIIPKSARN